VEAARARDSARCASTEKEAVPAQTDVGADFLADLVDSPAQAVRRAQELASTGEFTVEQILDEAADSAVQQSGGEIGALDLEPEQARCVRPGAQVVQHVGGEARLDQRSEGRASTPSCSLSERAGGVLVMM
jgi:hypothetical protein